jgi:16S rRNA (adenine1518-N6/adenine1519-N6)-dimethyltransferase
MSHSEIQRRYSIEPKKSLGQNFLTNDHILASIAELKSLQGKHVIEVGPGYGALTEHILKQKPASLTLVEFDPKMIAILKDRYAKKELMPDASTEFEILHQDVLHFSPKQESIVVANIPYYITSPILFRFLYEVEHSPSAMVILMQQEVGDKIRESRGFGASYLSLACANRTSEIHEAIRVSP